jgi:antitoxin VapB
MDIHILSVGYPNIPAGALGMPLYIKDDRTARLVSKLAKLRRISKQDAVRMAVQSELDRASEATPLRERFATLRRMHPLPRRTGQIADKMFFDELSGER